MEQNNFKIQKLPIQWDNLKIQVTVESAFHINGRQKNYFGLYDHLNALLQVGNKKLKKCIKVELTLMARKSINWFKSHLREITVTQ
jgi:hypothetical protein